MTGIIDVGGGMRGIYGSGVFDRCLEDGIRFDTVLGISAGSANAVSFLSGQRERNYRFYQTYSFRKEYMSLGNFLRRGSYVDLDYIYGTLSDDNAEYPLDYDAMMANPASLVIVATNALTGEAEYFGKADVPRNDYFVCKASSCLPIVGKPVFRNGIPYYDGGVSDPVPVEKLQKDGCDKIVLILTKPRAVRRTPGKDKPAAKLLKKQYPLAARGLYERAERYNRGVEAAERLEKEGKALILAPDDCCGVDTLKRTHESLDALYRKGYEDAAMIRAFLEA